MTERSATTTFDVVVGATPSGEINVRHEIDVLKPALLYGDSVTLISPAAATFRALAESHPTTFREGMERTAKFFAERDPKSAAEAQQYLDERARLAGLGWRTASDRKRWASLLAMEEKYEREHSPEERAQLQQILTEVGYDQLLQAEAEGILTIDPLLRPDGFFQVDLVQAQWNTYVTRLCSMLTEGTSYPLIDNFSGLMAEAAIIDGLITPVKILGERGKQVGTASHLLRRLPAFPSASISEILDLRRELREPLIRFRAAMIEFAGLIDQAAYEKGFAEEVEELARARVDPAMLEIEERVRDNKYHRHFQRNMVDKLEIMGPLLTVGIASLAHLPTLLGPAIAAFQVLWNAELARRKEEGEIHRHQLYLLYQTGQSLGEQR